MNAPFRNVSACGPVVETIRCSQLLVESGNVEQLDLGHSQAALGEDIDAAPALVRGRPTCPSPGPARTGRRAPRRAEWDRTPGPSMLGVQLSAHSQDRVAHDFGLETSLPVAPEHRVVRIDLGGRSLELPRSLIRLRQHDQPVQRLEPPAAGASSSDASQSSSSGWVGSSPMTPRSLVEDATSPGRSGTARPG